MNNKNLILRNIFLIFSIIFFMGLIPEFVFLIFEEGNNLTCLIIFTVCLPLFLIFYFLAIVKYHNYELKYIFLGKQFKKQLTKSMGKFTNAPEGFLKAYIKMCKNNFRQTGNIFQNNNSDWIFKNKKYAEELKLIYKSLYSSIVSKTGFIQFFDDIENINEDSYTIFELVVSNLTPGELRFLLTEVYTLCEYCLKDNDLSEEFTEKNNQNKQLINEVYSPILFNFENELHILSNKLEKTHSN